MSGASVAAGSLAAAVQLTSTADEAANWESARRWIELAAARGARLVATPENTNYLGPHDEKVRRAEALDGPTVGRFAELARRLGLYLLLGSFNERSDEPSRCYNTSVLLGPDGEVLAAYRKLHLFDVDVPGGVRFAESATCKPGPLGGPADPDRGLAVASDGPGLALAEIDLDRVARVRRAIPVREHRRL